MTQPPSLRPLARRVGLRRGAAQGVRAIPLYGRVEAARATRGRLLGGYSALFASLALVMLSKAFAADDVPPAPSRVWATTGTGMASVFFELPAGASAYEAELFGAPRYSVVAEEVGSGGLLQAAGCATHVVASASPAYMVGLPDGARVRFAVTAQSAAGDASATLRTEPLTIGAPSPPARLGAEGRDQAIFVSWAAPAANAQPITRYTLNVSTVGEASRIVVLDGAAVASQNASALVSGLTNLAGYQVAVTATSATGVSQAATMPALVYPQQHSEVLVVAPGTTYVLEADKVVGSVDVQAGATLKFKTGAELLRASVVDVSGTITGTRVNISAHDITVRVGGAVHADGVVVASTSSPGYNGKPQSGCSHGNVAALGTPGSAYGSPMRPVDLGSAAHDTNKAGGAVRLEATGLVVVDGRVSADAVTSNVNYGGGSGGSVLISATGFTGSGTISADGGDSRDGDDARSGGAGGRVSVTALSPSAFGGTARAVGGVATAHGPSRDGTVFLDLPGRVSTGSALVVPAGAAFLNLYQPAGVARYTTVTVGDGAVVGFTGGASVEGGALVLGASASLRGSYVAEMDPSATLQLNISNAVTIGEGASLTAEWRAALFVMGEGSKGALTVAGSITARHGLSIRARQLTVVSTGELAVSDIATQQAFLDVHVDGATTIAGAASATRVTWVAHSVSLEAEGAIHADALSDNDIGTPEHGGGHTLVDCYYAACFPAGSHGGVGFSRYPEETKPAYGSPTRPTTLGSKGSYNGINKGGGAVRIDVAGTLAIAGTARVSSDGLKVHNYFGSGAGGSVWITARTLEGSGTIRAHGGPYSGRGTGGAGGRVAVYVSLASTFTGSVTALHGGQSGSGTVFASIPGQVNASAGLIQPLPGLTLDPLWLPGPDDGGAAFYQPVVVGAASTLGWARNLLNTTSLSVADTASFKFGSRVSYPATLTLAVVDGITLTGSGAIEGYESNLEILCPASPLLLSSGRVEIVFEDPGQDSWDPESRGGRVSIKAPEVNLTGPVVVRAANAITIQSDRLFTGSSLNDVSLIAVTAKSTSELTVVTSVSSVVTGRAYGARVHWRSPVLRVETRYGSVDADSMSDSTRGSPTREDTPGCYYANCLSSGSHGGVGGGVADHLQPRAYGDPLQPTTLGSMCGYRAAHYGGGVVRVEVDELYVGKLAQVSSSGLYTHVYFGGGSGGSLWITTKRLSGSGLLKADGTPTGRGNAGAGGRVAVYVTEQSSFVGEIRAVSLRALENDGNRKEEVGNRHGTVYLEIPGQVEMAQGVVAVPAGARFWPLYVPANAPATFDSVVAGANSWLGWAMPSLSVRAFAIGPGANFTVGQLHEHPAFTLHVLSSFSMGAQAEIYGDLRDVVLEVDVDATLDDASVRTLLASVEIKGAGLTIQNGAVVHAFERLRVQVTQLHMVHEATRLAATKLSAASLWVNASEWSRVSGQAHGYNVEWHSPSLSLESITAAVHADAMSTNEEGKPETPSDCKHTGCPPAGSHGGRGAGDGSRPGYGLALAPTTSGSMGSYSGTALGGGILRLRVGELALAQGSRVSAHGRYWLDSGTSWFGGGAGGSVDAQCGSLSGTGHVGALGGYPATGRPAYGGAGGRVLVRVSSTAGFSGGIVADAGDAMGLDLVSGAGTAVVEVSGDGGVLYVHNPHGKPSLATYWFDVMPPSASLASVALVRSHLAMQPGASLRTRNITTVGPDCSLTLVEPQSVVITGDVCASAINTTALAVTGHPVLAMHFDDGSPTKGNMASGTVLRGVVNADPSWTGIKCRFGSAFSTVVATTSAYAACAAGPGVALRFECAVPSDYRDVGEVEVTLSVDNGARFHSFDPPHMFRFVPAAVCDLFGTSQLPPGCTIPMLGDGNCDAACNTAACAADNRDCGIAPLFVAPGGSDSNDGTAAQPLRTLAVAVARACSGFTVCLPVHVMPGEYDCNSTRFDVNEKNVTIAAADSAQPAPVLRSCSPSGGSAAFVDARVLDGSADINVSTGHATMTGLSLRLVIEAGAASVVELVDCEVGDGHVLGLVDSVLRMQRVTFAGTSTMLVDHDAARVAAFEPARAAGVLFCPSCLQSRAADGLVQGRSLSVSHAGGSGSIAAFAVADASKVQARFVSHDARDRVVFHRGVLSGDVHVTSGAVALADSTLLWPAAITFSDTSAFLRAARLALKGAFGVVSLSGTLGWRYSGTAGSVVLERAQVALRRLSVTATRSGSPAVESTSGRVALTLSDCAVEGPHQGLRVLAGTGTTLVVTNSSFAELQAASGPALLVLAPADVTVDNCTFGGNKATTGAGGAVSVQASGVTLRLQRCSFDGNEASGGGGGAASLVGTLNLVVQDSSFSGNKGFGGGGALYMADGVVAHVAEVIIVDNVDSFGGGVAMLRSSGTFTRISALRNTAFSGANFHARDSVVDVSEAVIGESSGYEGSGLTAFDNSRVSFTHTTIRNCSVNTRGGAILASLSTTVTLYRVVLTGNSATLGGAAAFAQLSSVVAATDTTVAHNAGGDGALLLTSESQLQLTRSHVRDNRAGAEVQRAGNGALVVPNSPAALSCRGSSVVVLDATSTMTSNWAMAVLCNGCNVTRAGDHSGVDRDGPTASALLAPLSCAVQTDDARVGVRSATPSTFGTPGGRASLALRGHWASAIGARVHVYVSGVRVESSGYVATDGTVNATVPEGAGSSHAVQVLVEGSLAEDTAAVAGGASVAFRPPLVSSVEPGFLSSAGGWITLNGEDLGPPAVATRAAALNGPIDITVNAAPCAPVTRVSHARVKCLAGPGVGAALPVFVSVAGQSQRGDVATIAQARAPTAPKGEFTVIPPVNAADAPSQVLVSLSTADAGGVPVATHTVWHASPDCGHNDTVNGGAPFASTFAATDGTLKLGGLRAGCVYHFSAATTNIAGLRSAVSNTSAVLVAVRPAAPRIDATARGSQWPTSLVVLVAPGFDGGSPVAEYVVSYAASETFQDEQLARFAAADAVTNAAAVVALGGSPGDVALHLSGLVAHRVYYLRVAADNGCCGGAGVYSVPRLTSVLVGVPTAPTVLNATFTGDFGAPSIDLLFLAPLETGGRSLATYRANATVTAVAAGAAPTPPFVVFGALVDTPTARFESGRRVLSVRVGPLVVGVTYTVTLAASNEFDKGAYGASSVPSRPELVAGPPTAPLLRQAGVQVTAFDTTHATLSVGWDAADWHGAPITAYSILAWLEGGSAANAWVTPVPVDDASRQQATMSATVRVPLPNSTVYKRGLVVAAAASNARGSSANSFGVVVDLPCRTGFGTSASDRSSCSKCTPGFWALSTQDAGITGATCLACDTGHYSSEAGAIICRPCRLGTYQPLARQSSCLPAPSGWITRTSGSNAVEQCPVGTAATANQTMCIPCPTGWASEGAGSAACTPCRPGFKASADAGSCVRCDAGSVSTAEAATECTLCPVGSFQPLAAQSQCLPVQTGHVTPRAGATFATKCETGTAASANKTVCVPCDPGYSSDGAGSASCSPCQPGSKSSSDRGSCVRCDRGTFAAAAAATDCPVCPNGTIAAQPGASACNECPPGTREVDHLVCEQCAAGRFAATAGSTDCLPCPVGTYQSLPGQPTCIVTKDGDVTMREGSTQPTTCPLGTAAAPLRNACEGCPAGTASDGAGSTVCRMCQPGTYSQPDRGSCAPCAKGRYTDRRGVSRCDACPFGTYSDREGSTLCQRCQAGHRAVPLEAATACEACPADHFVSSDGTACFRCPEDGVTCTGGVLTMKEGYWSPQLAALVSAQGGGAGLGAAVGTGAGGAAANGTQAATAGVSLKFFRCMPGACVTNATTGEPTCASGRTGPLCAICKVNHVVVGTDCVTCTGGGANWAMLATLLLVLAAGTVIMVKRAMDTPAQMATGPNAALGRGASRRHAKQPLTIVPLMKILVNWLQVMSFMSDYEVPWPDEVNQLWSIAGAGSSLPVNAGFVSCTIKWTFYERFKVAAAMPIVVLVGMLAVPLWHLVRPSASGRWKDTYVTGCLVLLYLIYPAVTREAVRVLNCSPPIEGDRFLKADYRVLCGTSEHDFHVLLASLVIAGFCVGLPFAAFWALRTERKRAVKVARAAAVAASASLPAAERARAVSVYEQNALESGARGDKRRAVGSLGFLTQGYKPKHYYFECALMLRKFTLVAVGALFTDSADGMQIYAGLGVVVVFLCVQVGVRPFLDRVQHRMEVGAQGTAALSLYMGWLLLLDDSESTSTAVGAVIVFINVVLVGAFAYLVWQSMRATVHRKAEHAVGGKFSSLKSFRKRVTVIANEKRATGSLGARALGSLYGRGGVGAGTLVSPRAKRTAMQALSKEASSSALDRVVTAGDALPWHDNPLAPHKRLGAQARAPAGVESKAMPVAGAGAGVSAALLQQLAAQQNRRPRANPIGHGAVGAAADRGSGGGGGREGGDGARGSTDDGGFGSTGRSPHSPPSPTSPRGGRRTRAASRRASQAGPGSRRASGGGPGMPTPAAAPRGLSAGNSAFSRSTPPLPAAGAAGEGH